ncbi:MAG: hypothetical protein ACFFFK_12815 [Candidatus Thorarchaeota archaeon]
MSDIQEELNNRLAKCIKRETSIDLLDPEVISNLDLEDSAVIQEHGFKCVLKVIRKLGNKKFMEWINKDWDKLEKEAEEVEKRLIRFGSKIGDPVDVVRQHTLLTRIIENLVEDIDAEELLSNPSVLLRLLLISYLGELKSRVSINSLYPLLFTVGLTKSAIGKDMSWSTSMLALTIEEQLVKKKAKEFGIDIVDRNYHSILTDVKDYLEEKGIRQSRDILIADSHRKIRNKVLHENWNPTEDEMDDIIAHVLKITQFFSSEELVGLEVV